MGRHEPASQGSEKALGRRAAPPSDRESIGSLSAIVEEETNGRPTFDRGSASEDSFRCDPARGNADCAGRRYRYRAIRAWKRQQQVEPTQYIRREGAAESPHRYLALRSSHR